MQKNNKMADSTVKSLLWKMGLPMIVSMVLQALYNVIDSIFVANMGPEGIVANRALTVAFPIQILIIALGVGTGVGLNALLSKSLGEKKQELVSRVAGNGIFLSHVIYLVFLVFGIFGAEAFIKAFSEGDAQVVSMGTSYLKIVTILSIGGIGFTIYERFLQATGRTMYSTIAQISGAVTNIILDYIFIYPLGMSVAGAAWATVIGQFVSLFVAMYFHYRHNPEINGNLKYIAPKWGIIKGIYAIGISAAIMQALLSVMMAGMNAILNTAHVDLTVLVSSFGIYYKIQQIALFSAFGLSNTIISVLAFNYGMGNKDRCKQIIRYGIIDSLLTTAVITVLFEILAYPLASLFGLSGEASSEVIQVCTRAIRIASIGYIFMGFSVAIQGVLQAFRKALKPLVISLLRLVVFVFPIAYLFAQRDDVLSLIWITFPIAEVLTAAVAGLFLKQTYREKVEDMTRDVALAQVGSGKGDNKNAAGKDTDVDNKENLVIAISRQHGTNGKRIARALAKELGLSFYDKEEVKNFAIENKLVEDRDDNELYKTFLSLEVEQESIVKQAGVIRSLEERGGCVIVGRGADYVLKDNPNLIRIFLYAPKDYRVQNIMKNYGDTEKSALAHIKESDQTRAKYYEVIAGKKWGAHENYDLCINCSIGQDRVIKLIKELV